MRIPLQFSFDSHERRKFTYIFLTFLVTGEISQSTGSRTEKENLYLPL